MPLLTQAFMYLLALGAFACGLYWITAYVKLVLMLRGYPTARDGIALGRTLSAHPSVCVIVPAHNEERVISGVTKSLLAQDYPNLRVVFSLDRCTDRTGEIVQSLVGADPRFAIHAVTHCPDDWAGKVNAMVQGFEQAEAPRRCDLLLFIDADTLLEPACVSSSVALLQAEQLDMLTLLSTLTSNLWFERVAQPVATVELMRRFPLNRANSDTRRRPIANGQYILFRRSAYESIDGHRCVATEINEDIAIARVLDQAGKKFRMYVADGVLVCRMYDTYDRFRRGWKRIYGEAVNRRLSRLRKSSILVAFSFTLLPLAAISLLAISLLNLPSMPPVHRATHIGLSSFGILGWLLFVGTMYRLSRTPLWAVPMSILGGWLIARVLWEAASDLKHGVPVSWGGRQYVRQPR